MRVLIVHPDLGVGGAERLIVDAALAIKGANNEVTLLTNHYDPSRCFEDTRGLDIIVSASWLPRHIAGRFHAFFAYLKMFIASLWLVLFSDLRFDIVICDQISLPVAVFKWRHFRVLFYCHFPDQLLCVYDKQAKTLKHVYRRLIDWLELKSTGMADIIVVNSQFTRRIFYSTFPQLAHKNVHVLYPSLNTRFFDSMLDQSARGNLPKETSNAELNRENTRELAKAEHKRFILLSINRYERKKDLRLAVESMAVLRSKMSSAAEFAECHLILAGGYDVRVAENVQHYDELNALVKELKLETSVSFLRSISDGQKVDLLSRAHCLIYTPTNEHFGIVPIEAMYCKKPVIATKTGGPLETVVHGSTGFLVDATSQAFAGALHELISDERKQEAFGQMARSRVLEHFSFDAFQLQLNSLIASNESEKKRS